MLSRIDNPPPQIVHPLRSRIVFFMRDWSLTLYVAPFALARPSYWFFLILPLAAAADGQLRRDVADLGERDPSCARWQPSAYFRINFRLWIVLFLISVGIVLLFGPKATPIIAGLWFVAWSTLSVFDPALGKGVYAGMNRQPRYKDGQIQYPALFVGPLHIILMAEFCRFTGLLALFGDSLSWINLSISASMFCLVTVMYWVGAFYVRTNDIIGAERRGQRR